MYLQQNFLNSTELIFLRHNYLKRANPLLLFKVNRPKSHSTNICRDLLKLKSMRSITIFKDERESNGFCLQIKCDIQYK